MNLNGIEYFYVRNLQQDVIALTDINGKIVVTYQFDAWGNIISTKEYDANGNEKTTLTLAKINPYRYRGYRYDEETGWYYLNSRYYNPEIGRFINADGQLNGGILGKNLYAYCENNPVMMVDPTGYSGLKLGLSLGFTLGPVGWLILGGVAAVYVVAVVAIVVSENSTPGGFSTPSIDTAPGGYSSPPIDSTSGGFSTTLPGFTHEVFNGVGISTGYMFSQNDSKKFSPDQQALIELAKMGKKLGVSESEAQILIDWADKLNIPQHGPEVHPNRPGPASNIPHIHIGPVDHITLKFD